MESKALAIGIENYKEMIDKNYYYVDKSLLIKNLIDEGGKVHLFTRPRRFGKTLALSIIQTFFEKEMESDNSHYFQNMKIMQAGEKYREYLGQYPVIFLSLKSAKQPSLDMAYRMIEEQIAKEFKRHQYILQDSSLLKDERKRYEALMSQNASRAETATSLKFLSDCLKKYHQQNVIILIDEYDVPLENSYFRGFYENMIDFIRSLFESALKPMTVWNLL